MATKKPALLLSSVIANPALPQVAYSTAYRPTEFETDCSDHWLFDSGNASCLTGGKGGVLTLNGTAPTYTGALADTPPAGGAFIKLADGGLNGLVTPFTEQATMTEWAVIRKDSLSGTYTNIPLFGTYSDSDTTSGHMAYLSGGFFDACRTSGGNVLSAQLASTAAPPVNTTWLFVAVAAAPGARMTYVGGIGAQSDTPTKVTSDRKCAIGNAFFNNATWLQGARVLEYGVQLGAELSATELVALYARAKVRAARRGVTVYG